MSIAIIGAGLTGRGFIGRLMAEAGQTVKYIDKDASLVAAMKAAGSFDVRFFGDVRTPVTVSNYTISTWEDADLSDVDLIFVSVGGTNLADVGAALRERLIGPCRIITCENASKPAAKLQAAISREDVLVSEATVFCTTIGAAAAGTGTGTAVADADAAANGYCLDINSEDYPYLQFNADLLPDFVPSIASIRPIKEFGNFLTRKLFTYNAASCVIAYLGWLYGFTDYGEAANDPRVLELLDHNYAISNRVLCKVFGYDPADQEEFAKLSKAKFCSRVIIDTIARNAREPQRKLGPAERVMGPMKLIAEQGEDTSVLEMTTAAMLLYDNDGEDAWRQIKAENTPAEILQKYSGLEPDSKLTQNILKYYEEFKRS